MWIANLAERKVVSLLTDAPNIILDKQKTNLTRNEGAELEDTQQCQCVEPVEDIAARKSTGL
jgi:hypothetical protein